MESLFVTAPVGTLHSQLSCMSRIAFPSPDLWLPRRMMQQADHYPCPSCCGVVERECIYCDSGTVPNQFQVVIAGLTDDVFCAGGCSSFNGTYILDWSGGGPQQVCTWDYFFGPNCSPEGPWGLTMAVVVNRIVVQFSNQGIFGGNFGWIDQPVSLPMDCSTIIGRSLPATFRTRAWCIVTGSTCVVTAL